MKYIDIINVSNLEQLPNEYITNIKYNINGVTICTGQNHNLGSRGNVNINKSYNEYKSVETLKINANNNKQKIEDNFLVNNSIGFTITIKDTNKRKLTNITRYDKSNYNKFNEINKKNINKIYSIINKILKKHFNSSISYFYANLDFSANKEVHYHCCIRISKTAAKKIKGMLRNKDNSIILLNLFNNPLNKYGFNCKIQEQKNIKQMANYFTGKMFNIKKIDNEDIKDAYQHIPNFVKMQYTKGINLKHKNFKLTAKAIKAIIETLQHNDMIKNLFIKIYKYKDSKGVILNKVWRGHFNISKEIRKELLQTLINFDIESGYGYFT